MTLKAGTRLGPYEIVAPLGAGGMAEVYRARDTRLDRTVAVKVLSSELSGAPDARERFEREARTISTLNHPAICTLHDVGRHESLDYLVMELLEGETLADRIARGPVPLKEALTVAVQMGEGLTAAHRLGIVHRDLKPANVMLVKDHSGRLVQAKLLDFGLAKLRETPDLAGPVLASAARTDAASLTTVGSVLGTLQYMSPEQLEGKHADERSDIFAFGAVLYEMLTGRKAFPGQSQVSVMAAILEHDPPPVSSLQSVLPASLDQLVRGCLAKNPADRWQNVSDVLKQLQWIAAEAMSPSHIPQAARGVRHFRHALWASAVAVLAVAVGILGFRNLREGTTPAAIVRFEIPPPPGGMFPGANTTPRMAVSPDGRYLAFTVNKRDGKPDQLWIRRLDSLEVTQLVTITETTGEPVQQPFWSPDSRFVGFFIDGRMKKVDIDGGVVQTLCNVPGNSYGATWSDEGTILFGSSQTKGLQRVLATGGVPSQVTTLDGSAGETRHLWPRFLPDGRRFLYHAHGDTLESRTIYVGSLDAPGRTAILESPLMVDFAGPGHLLFMREGALLAQPFNVDALKLEGEPTVVAEGVQASLTNGRAGFTVSTTGVLVYRPGAASAADSQLVWMDRAGREISVVGGPSRYRGIELSPDGRFAAVHREDLEGTGDLWIFDLERGAESKITFDAARHNVAPVWSHDGRRIIFAKIRPVSGTAIFERDVRGTGVERLVYESKSDNVIPWSVSPDGTTVVVSRAGALAADQLAGANLLTLALQGNSPLVPYIEKPRQQIFGQVSPDGRWTAYTSNESGQQEVFVQSFPKPDTRYQVSINQANQPRWTKGGRELSYVSRTQGTFALMAVAVETLESGLRFEIPERVFDYEFDPGTAHPPFYNYAVTRDGERFLVSRPPGVNLTSARETPIAVVINWNTALARR